MDGNLIDFNDYAQVPSEAGINDLIDLKLAAKEEASVLALSDFLGSTPCKTYIPPSNKEDKSLLSLDPVNLLPFGCTLVENAPHFKLDAVTTNNQTGFSPLSCWKESSTKLDTSQFVNVCNSQTLPNCEVSNLISPFSTPIKVVVSNSNDCLENEVTTGELLLMQEEIKMPDDMFDIAVLPKKQSVAADQVLQDDACFIKPDPLCDNGNTISIQRISSSGSNGTMNRGFIELSDEKGENDKSPIPDDSVFVEAQALSTLFYKLSLNAYSPSDGIENEDSNITNDCPDFDDFDTEDIEIHTNHDEIKNGLDICTKIKEFKGSDIVNNENNNRCSNSLLSAELGASQCNEIKVSNSSTSSISPIPISTLHLDHMKLKVNEVIGAPVNFGPLKVNAISRPSVLPSKTGPLKAFLPVGKMIKNKLQSPTTTEKPKGTTLITDSSPSLAKERHFSPITTSTPKIFKPCIPAAAKKGVLGSIQKSFCSSKVNSNGISTPTRPLKSGIGIKKGNPNTKVAAVSGVKKLLGPSQVPNQRCSSISQVVNPPSFVRSNSAGHLPLTPRLKEVGSSPHLVGVQSPLRRSTSLSTKLYLRSPTQPLAANYNNSPAKQITPLNKLMLKFRRNNASKGMKENISP